MRTGIIRRIDELGRIVLPMEMRRTMKIREGDSLEISSVDDAIMLQKYSLIDNSSTVCQSVAKSLGDTYGLGVIVFDSDKVVASANLPKKEWVGRAISSELFAIISHRRPVLKNDSNQLVALTDPQVDTIIPWSSQIIVPIINGGDLFGGICIMTKESDKYIFGDPDLKAFVAAGNIMSSVI